MAFAEDKCVDAYDFYKKEKNAVVLTEVNVQEFFYMFLECILHKNKEELDLLEVCLYTHMRKQKEVSA